MTSGRLTASWASLTTSAFLLPRFARRLPPLSTRGASVGSGILALSTQAPTPVSISGSGQYGIDGDGSLSFYGPGESSMGVSGNWDSYTATVTGNISITLTTGALTLNGKALPAARIRSRPPRPPCPAAGRPRRRAFQVRRDHSDGGTFDLGLGAAASVPAATPLDPTNGVTLDGYTGTIDVRPAATAADAVALNGNATAFCRSRPARLR